MESFDPKEIIDDLPIKKNITAVDFGCGAGGWTIPLAEKLEKGVVYAIDILEEPLSALRGKMKRRGIANIKVLNQNIESGVDIKDDKAQLLLMTTLLFQTEDREKVFSEAYRILEKEGLLLVTEWSPESPIGKGTKKLKPEEIKSLAEEQGFNLKQEFQLGMYQYGFVYEK